MLYKNHPEYWQLIGSSEKLHLSIQNSVTFLKLRLHGTEGLDKRQSVELGVLPSILLHNSFQDFSYQKCKVALF